MKTNDENLCQIQFVSGFYSCDLQIMYKRFIQLFVVICHVFILFKLAGRCSSMVELAHMHIHQNWPCFCFLPNWGDFDANTLFVNDWDYLFLYKLPLNGPNHPTGSQEN